VFQLTLEKGYSLLVMVAAVAAAVALIAVCYRRAFRQLGALRWHLLLGLRLAAVLLVSLLLFRPVLSFQKDVHEHRAIVFLVDTSASMSVTDDAGGATRLERARTRVLDWWSKLRRDFDLHVLAFADLATPLEKPGDLARLAPDGPATSLTRALQAAAGQAARRDIEAVVLLSDGVHNAAGDPVRTAGQLGLVVHTVGVGNSLRESPSYRDIAVTGLDCPERLPLNNRARLTAAVDAVGLAGRVVKVILEEDGKPVDEKELILDGAEGSQSVDLEFVPKTKGRHTYTARVPVLPDEKITLNNARSAAAVVADVRLRVLYLEGTLRAEFGAIVDRFLAKDPDVEFCALVQTRPGVFAQRSNIPDLKLTGVPSDPAVLGRFHVMILGDLDRTYLKPEQMEALRKRVHDGCGLVMLGGYHSLGPGGYAATPLEEALPVRVGDRTIGQVTDAFVPALTPDGRHHPIFANIARFFPSPGGAPAAAGLPPLDGCVKVAAAKPDATTLAVYVAEGAAPMPVLAVRNYGKGRSAAFAGDTTRNWQQGPRALGQESPFLRFWGQLVRWLANRQEAVEPGLSARTDRAYYEPDAPITVLAVVRDKEGEGTTAADVVARITGPDGAETIVLSAEPGAPGHYKVVLHESKKSGTYTFVFEARVDGRTLTSEKLVAEVGRPNLEYDRLDLDDKLLNRLAAETGGRYFHISVADRLVDELSRADQRRRVTLEQPLYWPAPYWLLFVGLLTTEWVLRKRYQLR
jgi:uncharacterized membrane protein